jgi:hypothetical protein
MIELLEGEQIVADLRKGVMQRMTEDVFLKSTLLLTNKRLVLVKKKLGAFSKQYIFLKDIQGLSSQRAFNLWLVIPAILVLALGVTHLIVGHNERDLQKVAAVELIVAAILAFLSVGYRIRISTTSDNVFFRLERGFGMERADKFIGAVQVQADRLKSDTASPRTSPPVAPPGELVATPPVNNFCTKCGVALASEIIFCGSCGARRG